MSIHSSQEIKLDDEEFIVSKTDTSGRITYANRVFMEISGYAESELLGVQQNIIRHHDMPRGVYRLLWNTIESGSEFLALLKTYAAMAVIIGYWQTLLQTSTIMAN